MAWWKSILDVGGLVTGAKIGSRWRTEARKIKKARRMALAWVDVLGNESKGRGPNYDWKRRPMVSTKTLRSYVNVYGDAEMNKILKAFRVAAKSHQLDVLN